MAPLYAVPLPSHAPLIPACRALSLTPAKPSGGVMCSNLTTTTELAYAIPSHDATHAAPRCKSHLAITASTTLCHVVYRGCLSTWFFLLRNTATFLCASYVRPVYKKAFAYLLWHHPHKAINPTLLLPTTHQQVHYTTHKQISVVPNNNQQQ